MVLDPSAQAAAGAQLRRPRRLENKISCAVIFHTEAQLPYTGCGHFVEQAIARHLASVDDVRAMRGGKMKGRYAGLLAIVGASLALVTTVNFSCGHVENACAQNCPAGPAGPQGPAGDPLQAVISYDYWDSSTHALATRNISVAEGLCVTRHGLWNASTSRCEPPLKYGVPVPRTDSDAAARTSCPTGFVPADCATAVQLLRAWRLNPNRETPNGHAWCAGTVDGTLNSGKGLVGAPGYWYVAGATAPDVCPEGAALVVDQCTPGEHCSGGGIDAPYLPHFYCQPVSAVNPWMCVATAMP